MTQELESVAVDWKSLRTTTACSCTTPFDQFSRKVCVYVNCCIYIENYILFLFIAE